jgi:hypothetical protein
MQLLVRITLLEMLSQLMILALMYLFSPIIVVKHFTSSECPTLIMIGLATMSR